MSLAAAYPSNVPPFEDICDFRRVMQELEIAEPRPRAQAHHWKWNDIRSRLLNSEKTDLNEVHRRAFALCNPGLGGRPHAATTLFASISVYFPGDAAPVHRHTASASRFALEGLGGFTNVGGELLEMRRGDLVITPNGEWHNHGNSGSEPVFWVDVLDVPLIEYVNSIMTDWNYTDELDGGAGTVKKLEQPVRHQNGYSQRLFGGAGIVPLSGWDDRKQRRFTPKYMYRAEDVRNVQESLRAEKGSKYDGIAVEYVDPTTGKSVVPTLSFRSQMLRPAEKTLAQRRTANTIFCALEGQGKSLVDGKEFLWSKNDIFVVPGWMWFEHENKSSHEDAILYSVTDVPVLKSLGVYRAQGKTEDGQIIDLTPWPDFA